MNRQGTLEQGAFSRADMLGRAGEYLLLALVASMPFEFRFAVFGLSNLQWLFVVAAIVSAPGLIRKRRELVREPVVIAVVSLALVHWTSAALSEEFTVNAVKAALRVTAGVVLVCIALGSFDKKRVLLVWCVSAVAAAVYGVTDHFGFGVPHLFRMVEFWLGSVQRLSGSFEYPNTAATFFAMSLPPGLVGAAADVGALGGSGDSLDSADIDIFAWCLSGCAWGLPRTVGDDP